jgi:hypothetical protein
VQHKPYRQVVLEANEEHLVARGHLVWRGENSIGCASALVVEDSRYLTKNLLEPGAGVVKALLAAQVKGQDAPACAPEVGLGDAPELFLSRRVPAALAPFTLSVVHIALIEGLPWRRRTRTCEV